MKLIGDYIGHRDFERGKGSPGSNAQSADAATIAIELSTHSPAALASRLGARVRELVTDAEWERLPELVEQVISGEFERAERHAVREREVRDAAVREMEERKARERAAAAIAAREAAEPLVSRSSVEPIKLTPEQALIAAAPVDDRLLVTAGAGTGKTHVLIERLVQLAEHRDLSLADDVLVMSFSRAAVWEIRRRMQGRGGLVPYGTVTTFDSFATRLLSRHSADLAWARRDYDGRIQAAIALIQDSEDAQQELHNLQHMIVDEVQDLVGVRRELVQAILGNSRHGFTLFGDLAQGIYNFQASDPVERQLGSLLFYDWVQNRLPGAPVRIVTLEHNFRYQTQEARIAEWAGMRLNAPAPDYPEIFAKLKGSVLDVEPVGGVGDLVRELGGGSMDETVGILCTYNSEVLRISQQLAENGVSHHYQRLATDRTVPAWVARALRAFPSSRLGKTRFDAAVATLDGVPDNAWELLRRFDQTGGRDGIDIQKVQERIRNEDIPAEFGLPPTSPIVVSTIHRAKGLEFDRVIIFEPTSGQDADDDLPERTRQLYVALTRARSHYGYLSRATPREQAARRGNPGDLWVVWGFAGRRRYAKELEIRGEHSWKQDPAGAFAIDGNAEQLQQYIDTEVRTFDPLTLRRLFVDLSEGRRVFYAIEHNGVDVGVVDIGWIVKQLCRPRSDDNWPASIEGIFVESVDTVAGTSAAGTRAGLTTSGLWLRVRPYGLGRLKWSQSE